MLTAKRNITTSKRNILTTNRLLTTSKKMASYNNQSFVGSERPTMKLLLNGTGVPAVNTMELS